MNQNLPVIAKAVRKDILTMAYNAQSAHEAHAYHIDSAFSVVNILLTLYFKVFHLSIGNAYYIK